MANDIFTPHPKLKGNYKLVWNDEFDNDTLDKNKWSTNSPKMGGRNVLIVEDTPNTIGVENGCLRLTAFKDNEGNYRVPNSVHTRETMNFKYGYVEIRAKLPLDVGCFASFWTRSVSDSSASALAPNGENHFAEVDMFEVFQNGGKQCVGGNILKNFPGQDKSWYATPMDWTQQIIIPDNDFHIYGYEWTPDTISLYFDGMKFAHFDIRTSWTDTTTEGRGIPGWDKDVTRFVDSTNTNMSCFNEAQYLIFNHHLHHKDGFTASTSVTENTEFSSIDYIIDYCRVYQLEEQELYTK